jgi:hypothetical protein
VVSPQAKVMVFERFDFTQHSRPSKAGGREAFSPTFNNRVAQTNVVLVDGSVTSTSLSKLHAIAFGGTMGVDDSFAPSGDWEIPDATLGSSLVSLPLIAAGRDGLENGDGSLLGIPGGFNKFPAFFWATHRGIQGRDLPR